MGLFAAGVPPARQGCSLEAQRELTEKLLFDYYLVSSVREGEVASPFPFYLAQETFEKMRDTALVLDGLVRRLLTAYLAGELPTGLHIEGFPHLEHILDLKLPLPPFYWVRFDTFVRPGGGIFFSEFNYDKPCAQRELLFNNLIDPLGNPNGKFGQDFVAGLSELWEVYSCHQSDRHSDCLPGPTVGIMVDPNHYEELHLAYLYKDLLEPAGFPCLIAGGKNFRVDGDRAYAFNQPVDIILRQYPMEHCDEIADFQSLLELYAAGRVLLVNDPRSILVQGKALFATLWELVDQGNDPNAFPLSRQEEEAIRQTIPRTWIFDPSYGEKLRGDKDNYVLKGNYSRYSEEVYIGRLHSADEWVQVLEHINANSTKTYVIQEFCESEPLVVQRFTGNNCRDTTAYGNFGVYLVNGAFAGLCARWSSDILTADDSWFSPVGLNKTSLTLTNTQWPDRRQTWREINDAAAFSLGYTAGYTGDQESFSLSCLKLSQPLADELYLASEGLLRVFSQTLDLVLTKPHILGPVLGIAEPLLSLTNRRQTSSLGLLGRLDWVLDQQGKLQVLEYNAETPGGLLETTGLNKLVADALGQEYGENSPMAYNWGYDPNQGLKQLIQEEFIRIIQDFSRQCEIKTIGFVSSTYSEDWQHTLCLFNMVKELQPHIRFVMGEVSGLHAKKGKLLLYDIPLDAVYRYYPLDWLEAFPGVLEALGNEGTLSINPVHTYVLQSKALLALVWKLSANNFFGPEEQQLIQNYLPKTTLSTRGLGKAFVAKPYFDREGQGVVFSEEIEPTDLAKLREQDFVFQDRVYIQQLGLDIYKANGKCRIPVFPVIGVYTVGNQAAGIYTRAGARITGKEAVYLPTFII